MSKDFSSQNLRNATFVNVDLSYALFSNSDLRGADFTGSDLTGADFSRVKTGITPANIIRIFLSALLTSALSGYVAMLTGRTVQIMLVSHDNKIRTAGILTCIIMFLFIAFSIWKGVGKAILALVLPVCLLASAIGAIAFFSGLGTGMGMLYLVCSLFLIVLMFIVGTIARAAAGSLSTDLIFMIVAMGGGMFGKSLGGGLGTMVMAISCAIISKKALRGAKGFEGLRKIASYITMHYGTSFRKSNLVEANFVASKIKNADFSFADVSMVNWRESQKTNCLMGKK
jgi:uncharacterized protein YjbI with pentapeptide repeats